MPAKYSVIGRYSQIGVKESPKKYYMINNSEGVIDTQELATFISERAGVSVGHVTSIITDMSKQIQTALIEGETVSLSGIGIMTMNLSSEGTITESAFTQSNILRAYIHLRMRRRLKVKLTGVQYKKTNYVSSPVENV